MGNLIERMPLFTEPTPGAGATVVVPIAATTTAILSWNAPVVDVGRIDLRVRFADGTWSTWLGYAERTARTSRSFSEAARDVRVDVDVVRSERPFTAVEAGASRAAIRLAIATPAEAAHPAHPIAPVALDVPHRSQYVEAYPYEKGWCSPASLAMLLAYRGIERDTAAVARAVFDERYDGAGNWAFNVAYAGTCGLAAAVVSLDGYRDAARFLHAGVPLAVSYAWEPGALTGAPVAHTGGHLGVLRGFDAAGNPLLNDPAQPAIATTYDAAEFAAAWARKKHTAYVVDTEHERLVALANA
jgi:hypothetical protein